LLALDFFDYLLVLLLTALTSPATFLAALRIISLASVMHDARIAAPCALAWASLKVAVATHDACHHIPRRLLFSFGKPNILRRRQQVGMRVPLLRKAPMSHTSRLSMN